MTKTAKIQHNPSPLVGTGKFQWTAGGWFGSSLGSSAWMLVSSFFLLAHKQLLIATVAAGGFLVIYLASLVLWIRRDRVYPFHALMAMLSLMAFTLPFVWIFVQKYASAESKNAMNWPISWWSTVFVVLLVPAIMIWFAYSERQAKMHKNQTP